MIYLVTDPKGTLHMASGSRSHAEQWIAMQTDGQVYSIEEEEMC